MTTECPNCERHFVGAACPCGFRPPSASSAWQEPEWMRRPPPCTPEQNAAALQVDKAVLGGTMTVAQGHATLAEVFGGRG